MVDYSCRRLTESGYAPYYLYRQKFMSGGLENVGWGKPGCDNLYNICIMEELCTILAMGGGASTKLVTGTGRLERFFAPKYPADCPFLSQVGYPVIKEFYHELSAD